MYPRDAFSELGLTLGMGNVHLDESGRGRMLFDGAYVVDFAVDSTDPMRLRLSGNLCDVDMEWVATSFLETLLHANFLGEGTGGAKFCLDAGGTGITLVRSFRMDGMDINSFSDAVGTFVNYYEGWMRKLGAGELDPHASAN